MTCLHQFRHHICARQALFRPPLSACIILIFRGWSLVEALPVRQRSAQQAQRERERNAQQNDCKVGNQGFLIGLGEVGLPKNPIGLGFGLRSGLGWVGGQKIQ